MFGHGQLYVGVSRVGGPEKLKFAVMKNGDESANVRNVVFREVLLPM